MTLHFFSQNWTQSNFDHFFMCRWKWFLFLSIQLVRKSAGKWNVFSKAKVRGLKPLPSPLDDNVVPSFIGVLCANVFLNKSQCISSSCFVEMQKRDSPLWQVMTLLTKLMILPLDHQYTSSTSISRAPYCHHQQDKNENFHPKKNIKLSQTQKAWNSPRTAHSLEGLTAEISSCKQKLGFCFFTNMVQLAWVLRKYHHS